MLIDCGILLDLLCELYCDARIHKHQVYGYTSDRLWIGANFALIVLCRTEPRQAPGWQVNAIDADVKQVITFWLQTLDSSVFTHINPGAIVGQMPRW
jgi:hypothetical protein